MKTVMTGVIAALVAGQALASGFPASGKDGHRVDGDKVDAYAEATVNADGSWRAFVHTNNVGNNKTSGGCNRVTLHFYNAAGADIYHHDVGMFCTQPPFTMDRKDNLSGPAGNIPANIISSAAKFAVVVSDGHKDINWAPLIEAGKVVWVILNSDKK